MTIKLFGLRENKNKKFDIALLILIGVFLLIMLVFGLYAGISRPADKTSNLYQNFTINDGDDIKTISLNLEKQGIVTKASRFEFLANLLIKQKSIRPGTYYLSSAMDFSEISKAITNGIADGSGFVINPGYNIDQIANLLTQAGLVEKSKFLEVCNSKDFDGFNFLEPDTQGKYHLEGFLMPGEYKISPLADEWMIVITMLNQFDGYFTEEMYARAMELGKSVNQIITIASVIEQATAIDKDKADFAAAIYNCLNAGVTPPSGPLPAAPICSPSKASIKAALYPSSFTELSAPVKNK